MNEVCLALEQESVQKSSFILDFGTIELPLELLVNVLTHLQADQYYFPFKCKKLSYLATFS